MTAPRVAEAVKKSRGRPLKRIDPDELRRLGRAGISLDVAARVLEVDPETLRRRMQREPRLRLAWEQERANTVLGLHAALLNRSRTDTRALIFACKSIAGLRETTAIEVAGPDGLPIVTDQSGVIAQFNEGLALLERFAQMRREGPEDPPECLLIEAEDALSMG